MMNEKKEIRDVDLLLKRISNHLIVKLNSLDSLGLYHGKMGVALFFAHYARYTGELLYDDFAGELLNDLCEELNEEIPVNFQNGLCGIGWGILYLLENGFMEGDSNDILSELDKQIMERNLSRVSDLSLDTGLNGICCYIKKRVLFSSKEKQELPFDPPYLLEWEKAMLRLDRVEDINLFSILSEVKSILADDDLSIRTLGLYNGCAGYGLKILLT